MLLIIYGYYLLSVPPDAEFNEVIIRAKGGMLATFIGSIIVIYYIIRR